MNNAYLITSYFPPISYFNIIQQYNNIFIEAHENYQRQTIRNRCYILTANGVQPLIIPIIKTNNKLITSIEIDYSTPWVSKHLHAIRSAYGKTPFFPYFYEIIESELKNKHASLFALNYSLLNACLNFLKIDKTISTTSTYEKQIINGTDFRSYFSKKQMPFLPDYKPNTYIQAFSDRFPFFSDLSIIDLIFNTGFEATLHFKPI